ncbi:Bucentaur or craniofacial development [Microdochium nivale]|nr:Bucentaur or craniofacial development [Microdochium nivale]
MHTRRTHTHTRKYTGTHVMAPDPMLLDVEDDDYASDQDSDFAPDDAPGGDDAAVQDGDDDDDASSSDGGDGDDGPSTRGPPAGRKRDAAVDSKADRQNENDDDGGEGFENSGDEAIIQKAHKKKLKKSSKRAGGGGGVGGGGDHDNEEEDEGGEGGLVRTRAMRAAEKAERRDRGVVPSGPVTVDVDDLWARMTAGPVVPGRKPEGGEDQQGGGGDTVAATSSDGGDKKNQEPGALVGDASAEPGDDVVKNSSGTKKDSGDTPATIKIKRTYNFAGKVHTEEKLVARDSAEAKLYIASLDPKSAEYLALTTTTAATSDEDADADAAAEELRRPRKAFRSIFEPVVADPSALQRADLNLGLSTALQLREASFRQGGGAKAKKLNVVEKSRMDWAGFVDKEGIKDELELAGRSKESYAHRQDFLGRVEANREDEARRARLAGRG